MKTSHLKIIVLTSLLVCPLMFSPYLSAAPEGVSSSDAKIRADLRSALPTLAELPGFDTLMPLSIDRIAAEVTLKRKSDDLTFRIGTLILPSVAEAHEILMADVGSGQAGMKAGCPSNRAIGEEVFQSDGPFSDVKREGFALSARDGCSVVIVYINHQSPAPMSHEITQADYKFCEEQVIKAFNKLTKTGHTSKTAPKPIAKAVTKKRTTKSPKPVKAKKK